MQWKIKLVYIGATNEIQIWFYFTLYIVMKKIVWLLVVLFWYTILFTFAQSNTQSDTTDSPTRGITLNEDCMKNGQCSFSIYKFLGIRQNEDYAGEDSSSPWLFVQDIILAATVFIGTVVTLGIIVSGLMFIFAAASGKDPSKAKAGLKNSVIWLLIVVCSYSIIRLVQYIAKGI